MSNDASFRVYLVRHAETQENRDEIIQGQKDTLLNEMGKKQAELLGESLKDVKFGKAFSSDLRRAVDTAEAILKHRDGVELILKEELRERGMGDLEGKKVGGGLGGATGVELSSAFAKRLMVWWNQCILASQAGEDVLVATHGGVIVTLVRDLLGSRKMSCSPGVLVGKCMNGSVTVVEVTGRKGVLVRYGDLAHLDGMDVLESNADQLSDT